MTNLHCCEDIKYQVERTCEIHVFPFDCPDYLIHYSPNFNEYGIVIHDGGASFVQILHCPWCGTKLPESTR